MIENEDNPNSPFSILHSPFIKEGALFVADAHYPHHGDEFLRLLRALDSGELAAPQLFLMGDIFDLLFGCGEYIVSFSREAVEILQRISQRMEIHYFEGNHDFCLQRLFPDISVYSREKQPVTMHLGESPVMLSHGDRYDVGIGYELYSYLLRQCRAMCLLLPWEKRLIDPQIRALRKKKICRDFKGFGRKVDRILSYYPPEAEWVIEGHFHQGKILGRYVSLPSLACQKELGVVRKGRIEFVPLDAMTG